LNDKSKKEKTCYFFCFSRRKTWNIDQVCSYFAELGLKDTTSIKEEVITGQVLSLLDESDLKELKLPLGVRKLHLLRVRDEQDQPGADLYQKGCDLEKREE
jgi:hypothetical protein